MSTNNMGMAEDFLPTAATERKRSNNARKYAYMVQTADRIVTGREYKKWVEPERESSYF